MGWSYQLLCQSQVYWRLGWAQTRKNTKSLHNLSTSLFLAFTKEISHKHGFQVCMFFQVWLGCDNKKPICCAYSLDWLISYISSLRNATVGLTNNRNTKYETQNIQIYSENSYTSVFASPVGFCSLHMAIWVCSHIRNNMAISYRIWPIWMSIKKAIQM